MTEQGSPEWHALRCGKVTASKIADMLAKTKTGWGASRANYKAQLVAERLTGVVAESYTNAAMDWGKEKEPEAKAAYEFYLMGNSVRFDGHDHPTIANGYALELVDFVDHPTIAMSGASPDAMVDVIVKLKVGTGLSRGLAEIKCPNTATHIETLLGGSVPGKYQFQMQWQMACTGRAWCDFVSYDPRMPDDMRLFVRRLDRDDEAIAMIEKETRLFLAEIDATVEQLTAMYRAHAA